MSNVAKGQEGGRFDESILFHFVNDDSAEVDVDDGLVARIVHVGTQRRVTAANIENTPVLRD